MSTRVVVILRDDLDNISVSEIQETLNNNGYHAERVRATRLTEKQMIKALK